MSNICSHDNSNWPFLSSDLQTCWGETCQSRSQSRGMGTAPNQAPNTVPTPPQYVHFRTSTSVEYSKVINCRTVSSEGGDEERGYVERMAMWAAARRVCGVCVVNGAPKR